jgi:hypothetical protein
MIYENKSLKHVLHMLLSLAWKSLSYTMRMRYTIIDRGLIAAQHIKCLFTWLPAVNFAWV